MTERLPQMHLNSLDPLQQPSRADDGRARAPLSVATQQGYTGMFGLATRHAIILSFVNAFRVLALILAALIPLIPIMKKPDAR